MEICPRLGALARTMTGHSESHVFKFNMPLLNEEITLLSVSNNSQHDIIQIHIQICK